MLRLVAFVIGSWAYVLVILIVMTAILRSVRRIGPTEVGLVIKRCRAQAPDDNPIAFDGEAGYQAELLMPGLRFKHVAGLPVEKYPWVQVPAGEIGV